MKLFNLICLIIWAVSLGMSIAVWIDTKKFPAWIIFAIFWIIYMSLGLLN